MCINKDKREMGKDSVPEVKSELEQMKELYLTEDFVCYGWRGVWAKLSVPPHESNVLVHKKHEAIADAVIDNPDVEIEFDVSADCIDGTWTKCTNFFDTYKDIYDYQLKEIKHPLVDEVMRDKEFITKCDGRWNGYYIQASQEVYDKLISEGYKDSHPTLPWDDGHTIYFLVDMFNVFYVKSTVPKGKPFYIVNGEFTETKLKHCKRCGEKFIIGNCEVCGTENIPTNWKETKEQEDNLLPSEDIIEMLQDDSFGDNELLDEEPLTNKDTLKMLEDIIYDEDEEMETISKADEKKANFAKFGFEVPEFECELYKKDKFGYIVGFVKDEENNINCVLWLEDGRCFRATHTEQEEPQWNLTTIKPKWYEDESNFDNGVLLSDGTRCVVVYNYDAYLSYKSNGFKLASKAERDSLFCSDML